MRRPIGLEPTSQRYLTTALAATVFSGWPSKTGHYTGPAYFYRLSGL